MSSLLDNTLQKILIADKALLESTRIPIVTVSGSFQEDIKQFHGLTANNTDTDVVFSRAHYSMAVGVAIQAWVGERIDPDEMHGTRITKKTIDPKKAWLVDPTNYVTAQDWKRIELTEVVGKTLARHTLLKKLKDFIDQFGRSKLPIVTSITPPLLFLTRDIKHPILSLHVAAGNILALQGKTVVQVITDPHVREEYLYNADRPNMTLCVFDEKTKTDALEQAALMGKMIDPQKIIVTGPPVDPRIIKLRQKKHAWRSGPLQLCITTGGLGTNKQEIRLLLRRLLPTLRKRPAPYRLLIYAGTQQDIYQMVKTLAHEARVPIAPAPQDTETLRVLYHPQIVDANELLIKYGFSWADGFITKPSGDMAYDAAASGSFLLTLQEWGVWEHNVRETFEYRGISRQAEVDNICEQLAALTLTKHGTHSWVEQAMQKAANIEPLFLNGSKKILQAVRQV